MTISSKPTLTRLLIIIRTIKKLQQLILHGATIVKGFDVYKNVEFTETNPPDFKILTPFINDSLMDDIRVITCFENFMKGTLILNDFVVHQLTDKNKTLKYAQRDRPLKIDEVFTPS